MIKQFVKTVQPIQQNVTPKLIQETPSKANPGNVFFTLAGSAVSKPAAAIEAASEQDPPQEYQKSLSQ